MHKSDTLDLETVNLWSFYLGAPYMLERRSEGELPPKPHTMFNSATLGQQNAYEYVFTRDGFSGGFSILYLRNEPNAISEQAPYPKEQNRFLGVKASDAKTPIARRHIKSWEAPKGSDLVDARTALFLGTGTRISVAKGNLNSDYAFANWMADELYFVYEGQGQLITPFGFLDFKKHDYILIPKGVPYVFTHTGQAEMFLIEGNHQLGIPQEFRNPHGQLKLEAPYTHRDFRTPKNPATLLKKDYFSSIVSLSGNVLVSQRYAKSPYDTVGWDGSVYPLAFSIHDYLPKTGKIHLPPNLHMTFKSQDLVICSFVPRLVDYAEGAIPCPYPHANVHCDEIIYYVHGNFTSRKGINERSISFHPIGQPHGPQPGNYLKSVGGQKTDELAVMVDTWFPLSYTHAALDLEDRSYQTSWL